MLETHLAPILDQLSCQVPQPTCSWKWHPDTCQLGNPTTTKCIGATKFLRDGPFMGMLGSVLTKLTSKQSNATHLLNDLIFMCPAVPRPVTSSLRRAGFDSLYSNSGKLVRFATQSGSTKTLTRLSELSSSVGWLKFWRGCQSCHPPKSWSSKILPRLHSEQSSNGKSKPRIELTFLQVPALCQPIDPRPCPFSWPRPRQTAAHPHPNLWSICGNQPNALWVYQ